MEFIYIVVYSVSSFFILFVIAKIMGFRAIGELSFFDYVIGITIGSVAAEMATNIDMEWWKGVTAMAIYGVFSVLFSFISQKSKFGRKIVSGTPIILIDKGKISKTAIKQSKIDINDLITQARIAGYFDLSEIDYAIMETTGKISFLQKVSARNLNPEDFNFTPIRKGLAVNVVIDGKIIEENLGDAGITKKELERRIRQNNKKVENLILATINMSNDIKFFEK